jgi:integrase
LQDAKQHEVDESAHRLPVIQGHGSVAGQHQRHGQACDHLGHAVRSALAARPASRYASTKAVTAVGGIDGVPPHDLRHTCASLAIPDDLNAVADAFELHRFRCGPSELSNRVQRPKWL